ncbi:Ltp family lipoprotein [Acetobacter malorum]|uniref:Ltp family lipoprotein n=1 Tax=Acetobacter malorum TaxID=178901 RepID=UPI00248E24B7|nr:Ltp family lipoprotein [Acetobacter malorum]
MAYLRTAISALAISIGICGASLVHAEPSAVDPAGDASSSEQNSLTPVQRNAVRSATSYLSMSSFSRDGLIQQLSSDAGEGYSVVDATIAVDSLDVDWNENAVRSAKEYLKMSGFSCKGLIQQLSSSAGDKYTLKQATYGAHQAGAC